MGVIRIAALSVVAVVACSAPPVSTAGGMPWHGKEGTGPPGRPQRVAAGVVTQPTPPVDAGDFPIEPQGQVPADGDGLIPNPVTPTGSAIGPPALCTVTFASSAGATSTSVNAWIASEENTITAPTVVCLSGTFANPLHVWSKTSSALLEVAPAPGETAAFDLGTVQAADTDPNQYWSDSGGISIVDSRSVEIYGLTVESYTFDGTGQSPAGIYVTTRS